MITKAAIGMLLGLLALSTAPRIHAQGPAGQERRNVTEKDLAAFARAYVEVQKIRSEYEPALRNARDPKERQRVQQTGDAKIQAALDKQKMAVEKYNQIFAAVNGNEELRKKTLKLIEQERKST
jgi:hypothetical protein